MVGLPLSSAVLLFDGVCRGSAQSDVVVKWFNIDDYAGFFLLDCKRRNVATLKTPSVNYILQTPVNKSRTIVFMSVQITNANV